MIAWIKIARKFDPQRAYIGLEENARRMGVIYASRMLTSATATTFVVANLVSILLEAINVPVAQVTLQQKRIKNVRILTSAKTKMADVLMSALTHKVVTFVTAEMDS